MVTLFSRKPPGAMTGIVSTDNGVAIASVRQQGKAGASLQSCSFQSLPPGDKALSGKIPERPQPGPAAVLDVARYR